MSDTIFYNADYVVIEYIDMIKSPYLILLNHIRRNDRIREILKLEQIDNLDDVSLYEWYINRKHQNFLMDLNRYPDQISKEDMDGILEEQMNITPMWYNEANVLLLGPMLSKFKSQKFAKNIIIYHPHNNDYAKKNLEEIFGTEYIYVSEFEEAVDMAKENSTYFISDVDKLNILKDKGYLGFSSVTIPVEYRYNKKNMNDFKFDFMSLYKEHPFKLSYMRTCTLVEGADEKFGISEPENPDEN